MQWNAIVLRANENRTYWLFSCGWLHAPEIQQEGILNWIELNFKLSGRLPDRPNLNSKADRQFVRILFVSADISQHKKSIFFFAVPNYEYVCVSAWSF